MRLFLYEIQLLDRQVRRVLALLQTHELSSAVVNSHTASAVNEVLFSSVFARNQYCRVVVVVVVFFQDFSHSQICVVVLHC